MKRSLIDVIVNNYFERGVTQADKAFCIAHEALMEAIKENGVYNSRILDLENVEADAYGNYGIECYKNGFIDGLHLMIDVMRTNND